MKPQLTITIVAYHNYEQIKTAVASIEKYTDSSITKKLYISDNSEYEHCDSEQKSDFLTFLANYDDIEYIDNQKNLGFGKGHNVVIERIESDFHAIVNPDIEISEDVFSAVMSYMNKEENVGMVIPKIVDENGKIQR